MSLRFKSLLIFMAAVTLLFGIVVGLVKVFIERQFADIERSEMRDQAGRFSTDLQGELKVVRALVRDWARWSAVGAYAAGQAPGFVPAQLNEEVLAGLPLDFLGIWGRDGRLLHLATQPASLARVDLAPRALLAALGRERSASPAAPSSGFLLVRHQLVLFAHTSIAAARDAPPAGTLVGGRIFGPPAILSLERFTGFRFNLVPRPPAAAAGGGAVEPGAPRVEALDPQTLVATIPLANPRGEIIADVELSSGRPLHFQAGKTTRIFIIALASAAGILLFVVWYLLDANVIHPVRRLAGKVAEAATRGQLPSDLGSAGGDEISDLARCIEDLARTVAHTEASYRAVVEDQVDFIFRYLPNGRRTFVNDAFCRYVGHPREDLLGGDAHQIVADEDVGRVMAALERLTVEEPVAVLDHRVNVPGLAWFRRTDRAIFSPDGRLRELQCVARDFTQTHLTRARLEASEIRYRRLFETAADGILLVRRDGRAVADANPALCRLLDCDREDLVDRPLESIAAFKHPRALRTLARLLDGGAAEIALPRAPGGRRQLEITAGLYEAGGETIVQFNFRDVSQRQQAHDELRELSGHLLRSQDEERRRIARELHDSTAQNLSALQMAVVQLETVVPPTAEARARLEEVRALTDSSLREIRTMSYLLHPPLLDEVGLLFALQWYVNGFMTRTEKTVRLDLPESLDRLPPELETTIFRIVQEGLTNVHRHSGSRRAWIRLSVDHQALELELRDEGRGFGLPSGGEPRPQGRPPSAGPVMGVGIAGMRERLRHLNGTLVIESGGEGTTLRATVPLPS